MAYSELMKDFDRIRAYLRDFYVYGFHHRSEFTQKSARGYDNERRRVESWLGDYMFFGQDREGRRVFLSVDSRAISHNPLYRAFYAKSFTDRDIMLHFHLLDMLAGAKELSLPEIMEELEDRLNTFSQDDFPDESTIRIKLKEYASLGLIQSDKRGRTTVYSLSEDGIEVDSWREALDFFSEILPLGVIGTYLRRRLPEEDSFFRFKHHYILNALDSEAIYAIANAMTDGREISFQIRDLSFTVIPLKIYVGTWSGRQYLLGWQQTKNAFSFYRIDRMDQIRSGAAAKLPEELAPALEDFQKHIWGVSGGENNDLDHLEMTILVRDGEDFLPARLQAEKRCGSVIQVDSSHWKLTADVYDATEMLPWLKTFFGRVTELRCSDPEVERRFWDEFETLRRMYLEGGETG